MKKRCSNRTGLDLQFKLRPAGTGRQWILVKVSFKSCR